MSGISDAKSASKETFITALVFNAAVFGIEIVLFTVLRPYFKAIYEPRTYVLPTSKRAKPLSQSIFLWPFNVFRADYRGIIKANGMDAYFFVHFLRMMVRIFIPIWVLTWAILLPATSVGTHVEGKDSLDQFTYGNVEPSMGKRYWAHLILVFMSTFWIFYNIKREMSHFIIMRQQHLIEHDHAKSVQANTVLITGIPARYLTQDMLFKTFSHLPGGIKKIWINRNLKELPDLYDRRLAACSKLESAETALLRTAAKLRLKSEKAAGKEAGKSSKDKDALPITNAGTKQQDLERADAESLVPRDQRPTHRLGSIPFMGQKVDTIEWCRTEIAECTQLLEEGRAKISSADERGSAAPVLDDPLQAETGIDEDARTRDRLTREVGGMAKDVVGAVGGAGKAVKGRVGGLVSSGEKGVYPPLSSAFVTFNRQIAAHMASQVLTHHEPYRMSKKYVEVAPEDVIWANLGLNPYEQKIRLAISYAATAGLILLWAFPVAFVGAVSNVASLCTTYKWLAWICNLPKPVVGIISGILPPVALAVLMMLLPIVLRLLARFEGIPKRTGLELSLMTRFFLFQVLHSFLIVTLSAGIIASLDDLINSPTSIPSILASNLPKASTFFLTFVILQGLSGVAGGFLQIVPLILYYVKLFILGSTPRAVYGIKYGQRSVAWGTLFPGITLLVVISLGYSIISPIINGLAVMTFFLFYILYKYLFLWTLQQSPTSDTGGLFFPKAISHIFVGLYIQQVCLCALFFLAQDDNKKASAIPEGALMVVLIVITAGFQAIISNSYGPLLHALPLSLADKTYALNAAEEGITTAPSQSSSASAEERAKLTEQGVAPPDAHDEQKKKTEEDYGFAHPAASRPQRTVWIPTDELGLSADEKAACRAAGVDTSARNAVMDAKGKVDITGGPPDMVEAQ
ncbi:hypothetical protein BDQ12DRAFT_689686 [Crucibulum laeve]|uniref:DUF221-domain-containing protein n=1 Tax=Crucibulum laeve TaxID=68775 RepID=A0A5C3LQ98_9AGAR|nr:hypothetical protein BDQ12DRAFT_689686 [Crucibulum laeve]